MIRLFIFLLISASTPLAAKEKNLSRAPAESSQASGRHYERMRLRNGLDVYLISDEKAEEAGASLRVNVGGMDDPIGLAGLAHYMEHMLFIKNSVYPDTNSFQLFLSQNGGESNATTNYERTNYYFSVAPTSFAEALQRFAAMFKKPLFKHDMADKEKRAIDEEFALRKEHSYWRQMRVAEELSAQAGSLPAHFFHGNHNTLAKAEAADLENFFARHYCAPKMHLAVVSRLPLSALRRLVRKEFDGLAEQCKKVPSAALQEIKTAKPSQSRDGVWVRMPSSGQDGRKLTLQFTLPRPPPSSAIDLNHDLAILQRLLTATTSNSLYELLRRLGLVTKLESDYAVNQRIPSQLRIDLMLTAAGAEKQAELVRLVFSYLNLLRDQGLLPHTYAELQQEMDLRRLYEKPPEGSELTNRAIAAMPLLSAADLIVEAQMPKKYRAQEFADLLAQLSLSTLKIFSETPGQPDKRASSTRSFDLQDPYFGFAYQVTPLSELPWSAGLAKAMDKRLSYPPANEFMPHQTLQHRAVNLKKGAPVGATAARKVVDSDRLRLWYKPETIATKPVAFIAVDLYNEITASDENTVAAELIQNMLAERFFTLHSQFGEASYHYSFSVQAGRTRLELSGYSFQICEVFERLLKTMLDGDFDDGLGLELAKQELSQRLALLSSKDELSQLLGYYHYLLRPYELEGGTILNGLLKKTTKELINSYRQKQRKIVRWQVATSGDLRPDEMASFFKRLAERYRSEDDRVVLDASRALMYPEGKQWLWQATSQGANNAWGRLLQLGPPQAELQAFQLLAYLYLDQRFFRDLRTREQLAYSLGVTPVNETNMIGLGFYIVSKKYPPAFLEKKAEEWLFFSKVAVKRLTPLEFSAYKRSLLQTLASDGNSMDSRFKRFQHEVMLQPERLGYEQDLLAAIRAMPHRRFIRLLNSYLSSMKGSQISVHIHKNPGNAAPAWPSPQINREIRLVRKKLADDAIRNVPDGSL